MLIVRVEPSVPGSFSRLATVYFNLGDEVLNHSLRQMKYTLPEKSRRK